MNLTKGERHAIIWHLVRGKKYKKMKWGDEKLTQFFNDLDTACDKLLEEAS